MILRDQGAKMYRTEKMSNLAKGKNTVEDRGAMKFIIGFILLLIEIGRAHV